MEEDEEKPTLKSFNEVNSEPDERRLHKSSSELAADLAASESADKLKDSLSRLANKTNKSSKNKIQVDTPSLSLKERYAKAWAITYKSQQYWRRNEIDASLANKSFGQTRHDNDFVRQVVALAESDDPLAT